MKQKAIALALAGVMLFTALFPVRIGIAAFDDSRIQQAHAVAPAVVMPVLGALALASGVFLGGVTTSSYNSNLSGMYDYIENFLQTNYDASAETAILGTLTPFGAVNVGFMSAQLKNAIRGYVQDGMQNGTISNGLNSAAAMERGLYFGNVFVEGTSGEDSWWHYIPDSGRNQHVWSDVYVLRIVNATAREYYCNCGQESLTQDNKLYLRSGRKYTVTVNPDNGAVSIGQSSTAVGLYLPDTGYYVNLDHTWFATVSGASVSAGNYSRYTAILNNAVYQGLDNLQGIYEQFSPSDALLEQGISNADLIDAINTNTGTAQDVLSGVNALIGQFTSLLTNVGTIGDVIGDIGEDVASIPSVLDDVREGVLAFPDAISTGLAGVVSAVNAIPASIAGVLEGVTFPIQFPTLPDYDYTGTVQLPVGAWDSFQIAIRDKAPFCYLPRMVNALSAWWNMANVRSFYFDVPLPDGSGQSYIQRFDAEDLLSVEYGSTDVASIIRTMVTLSLCFALIYAAVNIAIWSVKGA